MPVQFPDIPNHVRAYFYRAVVALLALAVLKGWVDADEVEVWLGAAAAVLAVANTSTAH